MKFKSVNEVRFTVYIFIWRSTFEIDGSREGCEEAHDVLVECSLVHFVVTGKSFINFEIE